MIYDQVVTCRESFINFVCSINSRMVFFVLYTCSSVERAHAVTKVVAATLNHGGKRELVEYNI